MNILWFKKDLRANDHQPLARSLECGKTVGLFIFEEEWFVSPEFSEIHLKFALESLEELQKTLLQKGITLLIREGSAVSVFQELHRRHKISNIFSHEETGLDWTFKRDVAVKNWSQENSISWVEFQQFGVIRKLKNREIWTQKRSQIIERPLISVGDQQNFSIPWPIETTILSRRLEQVQGKPLVQKGGRSRSLRILNSFLKTRSENYSKSISSPMKAFQGCSRLSPYITWGNISMTEIHTALNKKKESIEFEPHSFVWKKSLTQFESRLWWHCHFIQKLESEYEIEFQNFNRKFDGLRESEFDETKFKAWCRGETGFPMIDACMRALQTYGWINFRMRAMLMSFSSYQLWLHWKKPAEFLARQFLDFEPGIHYSQAQMQSGVTGINTIRIYSPKKQALDQDPQGEFIRKFVPELQNVPLRDLAEPHLMPPMLQLEHGFKSGVTYPAPIVDPDESYNIAKQRIFEWKKSPSVKLESQSVLKKHAIRNHIHFPKQKR